MKAHTMEMSTRGEYRHSRNEELAHSLSHGIGALLAVAGLVLLLVTAAARGGARELVAASIYGATLVLLYTVSTLYHALPESSGKRVLQILDHSAIYLLIAGTYTPFTLLTLRGGWGWSLFGVIWGLALVGVVQELILERRVRWISIVLYLAMGWLVVLATRPLLEKLPSGGLTLLALGGLAYTGGIYFYLSRRVPYHHAIWHLFVLLGSGCHFLAVLRYVLP